MNTAQSNEINGFTRIVHVVADPVSQLRTPQAQNAIWSKRKLNLVTIPAHVGAEDLPSFLDALRVNQSTAGAVVTVPHKQTAAGLCDELGLTATLAGAVNAIRRTDDGRLLGETFDGDGFVVGLRAQGIDPAGLRVLIIGAGGAASAIALALIRAQVASLDIRNRTISRAEQLIHRLGSATGFTDIEAGSRRSSEMDLVVNATSVGMGDDRRLPMPVESFADSATVAEVVVSAEPTSFLQAALGRGLATHPGRHMLEGQMELIADFISN